MVPTHNTAAHPGRLTDLRPSGLNKGWSQCPTERPSTKDGANALLKDHQQRVEPMPYRKTINKGWSQCPTERPSTKVEPDKSLHLVDTTVAFPTSSFLITCSMRSPHSAMLTSNLCSESWVVIIFYHLLVTRGFCTPTVHLTACS